VVICLINQRDADIQAAQRAGRAQAAKASAHNHDVR